MSSKRTTVVLVTVASLAAALGLPTAGCKKQPAARDAVPADVTPLPSPPPADAEPPPADAAPEPPDAGTEVRPEPAGAPAEPPLEAGEPQTPSDAPLGALPPPADAEPLTDEEARVVAAAVNGLAADLHSRLAEGAVNMTFSPTSLALALGMTSGGAREETAQEMNAVLHLGEDPDRARDLLAREQRLLLTANSETVKLAIANRLFGERTYTFVPEFVEWTATQFAAPLEPMDFRGAFEAARGRINGWVKDQTHDRIPEILPAGSLDDQTRLVLANAIWFKGRWLAPFEERSTKPRPFTRADGSRVDVPMMARTGEMRLGSRGGARVLELPYDGEELSMIVVLPPDGESPDPWLTAANLEGIGRLPQQEVEVWLPRFKIDPSAPTKLNNHLKALGMPRAFQRTGAQFEGIGDPPDPEDKLYISAVFHRAFVEVNEEGTEAAAATAVVMARVGGMAADSGPARFHVDHPFLFLIRENRTGLVLFVGRVGDPGSTG